MNLDQAKQELVKRYKYLYENAYFIVVPYMYEESPKEFRESKKKYGFKYPHIYLRLCTFNNGNILFEEFLLSDKKMEETTLYKKVEKDKNDPKYLKKFRYGISLIEKVKNRGDYILQSLDISEILSSVADYIEEQSADLENKKRKLRVIDEYYRIYRYKNDGKIYTSGRKLDLHDCSSISIPLIKKNPSRNKYDIGIRQNDFIDTIYNAKVSEINYSVFTEKEKQEIYLCYHNELPCDYEITCELEEEIFQTMIDFRLQRPENTSPCGKSFILNEQEIFINPNSQTYRYYQLCPHCGFLVNIPEKILLDDMKIRIEEKCSKDDKLFRKMYLYSELYSLDKEFIKKLKI